MDIVWLIRVMKGSEYESELEKLIKTAPLSSICHFGILLNFLVTDFQFYSSTSWIKDFQLIAYKLKNN